MKVAVSFISSDYDLDTTIKKIDESKADYIHVDMMDGQFVENSNFTVQDIKKMFKGCKKKLDVHMMVCSPNKYIKDIAKIKNLGYVTIHYESHRRPIDVINQMKHANLKIGIAINPDTKVSHIIPLLHLVDQVLIMSVVPGMGGQSFITKVEKKIEEIRALIESYHLDILINVDGGVNGSTKSLCQKADILTAGSYIIDSDNFQEKISSLR